PPLSAGHLVVDPAIGLFQAFTQTNGRLPPEHLLDASVVAIASVHAFGRAQVVSAFQFHPANVFDDIDELIDRYQLATADVERSWNISLHHHASALQAIIDIHEATRLMTVAPNLDFFAAGELGRDH